MEIEKYSSEIRDHLLRIIFSIIYIQSKWQQQK